MDCPSLLINRTLALPHSLKFASKKLSSRSLQGRRLRVGKVEHKGPYAFGHSHHSTRDERLGTDQNRTIVVQCILMFHTVICIKSMLQLPEIGKPRNN